MARVCFVSNFNTYYRAPVFEALAAEPDLDVDFLFYSKGGERYWMSQHGVSRLAERQTDLRGFEVAGTRITPGLLPRLFAKPYDVYLKCVNGRFALPATYLAARLRGRPFVLWTEVWMRFRTPGHRLGYPLVRHIYRGADAVVACGTHVRDFLIEEGVDPSRILVARHAVNSERYGRAVSAGERRELRERLGLGPDRPVVLFVGRFTEVKRLSDLVEAFARLVRDGRDGDAILVLAGTGEEEAALKGLAERLGVSGRIVWPGYVAPADTVALYAIADVCVLPSVELDHIKETWGLVVNEAFNQGVPVVATDAVGAAAGGLVADGRTGFVVPERSPEALADRIAALIADPDLRARMSASCRAEIAGWTQQGMADSFAEAIRFALARAGHGRGASQPPVDGEVDV